VSCFGWQPVFPTITLRLLGKTLMKYVTTYLIVLEMIAMITVTLLIICTTSKDVTNAADIFHPSKNRCAVMWQHVKIYLIAFTIIAKIPVTNTIMSTTVQAVLNAAPAFAHPIQKAATNVALATIPPKHIYHLHPTQVTKTLGLYGSMLTKHVTTYLIELSVMDVWTIAMITVTLTLGGTIGKNVTNAVKRLPPNKNRCVAM
jgi:hypothetical protein